LKVAIVNQPWNHAPPATGGSIAIWTWEVARRLAKRPDIDEVYVYARRNAGQPDFEEIDGVRCVRYPVLNDLRMLKLFRIMNRRLGLFRHPFKSRWFYRLYMHAVAADMRRRGIELAHLHNISQHVEIVRRANPGIRIVLHMHCEWLTQLERSVIRRRISSADAVLGCSGYITGKIRDRFPEFSDRCHVVYNGVDVERFSPGPAESRPENGGPRLLFVGRITPEKAIHSLIEAAGIVRKRFDGLRLDIVGPDAETPREYIVDLSDDPLVKALAAWYDGGYLKRLKSMALEAGDEAVGFTGLVHPDDLPRHYRTADILVNPSVSESFGMSLAEAMACGVPVVATQVGGMPEIVDPGVTGQLVPPDDTQALARAIEQRLAASEAGDDLSAACRNRAVEMFSWDRVAESVAERYAACAGRQT
jgi:glycosyltransferase involved in cell wall biosynthesis